MRWRVPVAALATIVALLAFVVLAPRFAKAPLVPAGEAPFELYTHCGIDEAFFDGRYYEAVEPLSDGNGNPPPGWGNPSQDGTIRVVSATEASFHSDAGDVLLRVRPDATGFKRICA
jgi:hypothetical protein